MLRHGNNSSVRASTPTGVGFLGFGRYAYRPERSLSLNHQSKSITAGVIAETIGAPHNTLSTHLAILVRAGLLRSSRDGRTIIYRSDVEGIRSVIAFLVNDCCDGHPELCNLVAADAAACCAAPSSKTAARGAKKVTAKRKS